MIIIEVAEWLKWSDVDIKSQGKNGLPFSKSLELATIYSFVAWD